MSIQEYSTESVEIIKIKTPARHDVIREALCVSVDVAEPAAEDAHGFGAPRPLQVIKRLHGVSRLRVRDEGVLCVRGDDADGAASDEVRHLVQTPVVARVGLHRHIRRLSLVYVCVCGVCVREL